MCNPRKLWYVQRETALTPLSPGRPRVDASSAARGSGEPSRSAQSPLTDGAARYRNGMSG